MKTVSAILLAGGSGNRFGGERNKVYEDLCGRPVLVWSLTVLLSHPRISEVILAVRAGEEEEAAACVREAERILAGEDARHTDRKGGDAGAACMEKTVRFAPGGKTRTASVRNAAAEAAGDIFLVHDGARPMLRAKDIDACLDAMEEVPGALIAVPLADTIKRADPDGFVSRTVPRSGIFCGKTPQSFRRKEFTDAMARFGEDTDITDDCMLLERAGYPVRILPGSSRNIKITTREDLSIAAAYLRSEER